MWKLLGRSSFRAAVTATAGASFLHGHSTDCSSTAGGETRVQVQLDERLARLLLEHLQAAYEQARPTTVPYCYVPVSYARCTLFQGLAGRSEEVLSDLIRSLLVPPPPISSHLVPSHPIPHLIPSRPVPFNSPSHPIPSDPIISHSSTEARTPSCLVTRRQQPNEHVRQLSAHTSRPLATLHLCGSIACYQRVHGT